MNPQKSVQLWAKVEDFHRAAGNNFAPEKIFSTGCGTCHAERAKGKSGAELYDAVCAVCHRNGGISQALDAAFAAKAMPVDLRKKISAGIKRMPGFAAAHGGPLTAQQIDSLLAHFKSLGAEKVAPKAVPAK